MPENEPCDHRRADGTVFVTDGGYKHALAIVRSLGRRGLRIHCGGKYPNRFLSGFSRYTEASFQYPYPEREDRAFAGAVRSLSERFGYDCVIPVGYHTIMALSRWRHILGEETGIRVPEYSSMKLAADKGETVGLARELGVPVPRTYTQAELPDLPEDLFPVVVKGVRETGSVEYAFSSEDALARAERIKRQQGKPPLIQELVQGDGYGFFALYDRGRLRATFMHRRIREYPVSGGPSTCAVSVYERELLRHGSRLLGELKWDGVAMVEFKRDGPDGEFKLMEINPKFWGSLDLAIQSGVDFPYLLYRMIGGEEVEFEGYRIGVRTQWPFGGDIVRLLDRPRDVLRTVGDLFNPRTGSNISLRDPKPNLFEMMLTLRQISSRASRGPYRGLGRESTITT